MTVRTTSLAASLLIALWAMLAASPPVRTEPGLGPERNKLSPGGKFPAAVSDGRIREDLAFLEDKTKTLLEGCIIKASDGTLLYTPDGKAHYAALWTRDFASMVEYAGDLMPLENTKRCIAYLAKGVRSDGLVPDRVQADGRPVYAAGSADSPLGEPNIDNAQFLVFAVDSYLERVSEVERAALYAQWAPALVRGMNWIPRGANGLVWNDPKKPHSPYGFTDTVAKTGDLFMESVLYWRACRMLARWEGRAGNPALRDDFQARAAAIEKAVGSLWDDKTGMFLAASVDCRQTDIWGNAYAVAVGFPLGDRKDRILDYLVSNYDRYVWRGQVRHLPRGEYWQRQLYPVEKDTYQNGAFWGTASGWVMQAVHGRSPELARRMFLDLVEDFKAGGICECVNEGGRKLESYVNTATNPLGAARTIWPPSPAVRNQAPSVLTLTAAARELNLTKGLAVGLVGYLGRSPVPSDLVAYEIATGTLAAPREGLAVGANAAGQTQSWTAVEAGEDGWIQNRALAGGSLFIIVNSEKPRTMIFEASSYYVARINGEPRGGEKYGMDWVRHPVRLLKGRNEFLVQCERGRFRGRLVAPQADVFFTGADMTLPDLILGEKGLFWAGLRLVNATGERLAKLEVVYRAGGREARAGLEMTVAPFMTQKLAVPLVLEIPAAEGAIPVEIRARARAGGRTVETPPFKFELRAVAPTAHHVRTFVSEIDRSVQLFAVAPRAAGGDNAPASGVKPALVLTLHGAGVDAINQARAYKPKEWAYIVAPTNRRPYGFDWEDWGRLDALEVLAEASRLFGTDPDRTYLTGHSMGGHGTWQVGATVPGPWAAIAPSAGWASFSSYGGGTVYKDPSPVERMLARANNPSETTNLARNYLHYGVYILHGDQDDNVPVTQARSMRELLGKFHPDFCYYERPGAGHWWGNECVDWPPLFEFLKERVRPADTAMRKVEFVTANPGISSRSRFVEILAQACPLEYSKVVLEKNEAGTAVKGTTENVLRLALDIPMPAAGGKIIVEIDGSRVEASPAPGSTRVCLERGDKGWAATGPPSFDLKNPLRYGGFKDAFRHGFVLVYGTRGNAAENARAFGKARFDAEMFWVRGNGAVEVLPDSAFDPSKARDRSVILYGNADTNGAWAGLLPGCPVEVRNGRARAGGRSYTGNDIAAYFIRPRPGSELASVGVVAWSGREGWVAASPGQYFISGAGFPDLMMFSVESLRSGPAGVLAVGWFGDDWSLERGDIVWNDGRKRP